jgi:hypothetical protein
MSYVKVLALAVVYGRLSLSSASTLNLFSSLTTQGALNNTNTLTFTDDYGSGSIVASGFHSNGGSLTPLFYKTGGADETGLGMLVDPSGDHEINGTQSVQLDLSSLLTQYATHSLFSIVSATISLGSVQGGESYAIFGSNTAGSGSSGSLLGGSASNDGSLTLSLAQLDQFKYISITAPKGNVLVDAVSVTTASVGHVGSTPEPATSALMGGGLLGAAFLIRRRKTAKV